MNPLDFIEVINDFDPDKTVNSIKIYGCRKCRMELKNTLSKEISLSHFTHAPIFSL